MAKDDEDVVIGAGTKVLCWAGFIIALFLLLNPIVIVGAGERGVIMNFGAVQDEVWGEGLHFKMPIAQGVEIMSVQTQKYTTLATSASSDLQDVRTEVTVNYRLDAGQINKVYQTLRNDYEARVIAPAVQESVKSATAQFTAEELITKRPLAKQAIEGALSERLIGYGIYVEAVSLTDFKFSEQFTQSIEAKVTAVQKYLQSQNDLQRIEVEAQQIIATATAEATAIQIKGDALKNNPSLVQLEWVHKWSGTMPLVYGGSGMMNMLDISSMVSAQ